eukprot:7280122-Heterocapsa_arctica.AAC.1
MAASLSASLTAIISRGWCAVLRHEAFLKFKHKRLHTYHDARPDREIPREEQAADARREEARGDCASE